MQRGCKKSYVDLYCRREGTAAASRFRMLASPGRAEHRHYLLQPMLFYSLLLSLSHRSLQPVQLGRSSFLDWARAQASRTSSGASSVALIGDDGGGEVHRSSPLGCNRRKRKRNTRPGRVHLCSSPARCKDQMGQRCISWCYGMLGGGTAAAAAARRRPTSSFWWLISAGTGSWGCSLSTLQSPARPRECRKG